MLKEIVRQAIQHNPEYGTIAPVVEKEILHHDIIQVLIQQGALQQLTFIGGTALRMCHNSARLSEDLDFNGGVDFAPAQFNGLEQELQHHLQQKYDMPVQVHKPAVVKQGNTASWKISIVKAPNRPDLPHQKIHIDVCAIPSFDVENKPLINHYQVAVPTTGLLVPVQSLAETMADKLIAFAYRARRIKPRDIWDIVWLSQQGVTVENQWLDKKLQARGKQKAAFSQAINMQLERLQTVDEVKTDFYSELSRFLPARIRQRTLEHEQFWAYVQSEVKNKTFDALKTDSDAPFSMF